MKDRYQIGTEYIRRLAVSSHALDTGFDSLFNNDTICGDTEAVSRTYNELLAQNLLNLAISIRVALHDQQEYRRTDSGVLACALFESDDENSDGTFSIKDVCDKIIHAESIWKPKELGASSVGTELRGSYRNNIWVLHLGIQLFSEVILKWLEQIDARAGAS